MADAIRPAQQAGKRIFAAGFQDGPQALIERSRSRSCSAWRSRRARSHHSTASVHANGPKRARFLAITVLSTRRPRDHLAHERRQLVCGEE